MQMSQADVEAKLTTNTEASPLLAVSSAIQYIILSLAFVVAISFVLVLISFIIPAFSAYIIIPLLLLLMLLLGAGFLYRYFGNQLPFVDMKIQN